MKKNKLKAFTIAEAIITFVLMGSIFVLTVSNIDMTPKENYNKLYWQAFNAIYQASKSYKQEWDGEVITRCPQCTEDEGEISCYRAECWQKDFFKEQQQDYLGGTRNIDRAFPGFLFNFSINNALAGRGQDKEFCEKLVAKINTHPAGRCESFISIANPKNIKDDNSTGGVVFSKAFAFCNEQDDGTCVPVNGDKGIAPSFVALNGQKFYISTVVTANSPKALGESEWRNFENPERESYRFVVVDLNGDSKPNSQFRAGSRNPDIVLFAINSSGDVIPLGLPEFSQEYINAVVYYPNDLNEEGNRIYSLKSEVMSLWKAKKYAWGGGEDGCGRGLPYRIGISSIEPLSQSGKFYSAANNCKGDVKACAKKCNKPDIKDCTEKDDVPAGGIYADELFTHIVMQFLYKEEGSTELYPYLTEGSCVKLSSENGCATINRLSDNPSCAIDFIH